MLSISSCLSADFQDKYNIYSFIPYPAMLTLVTDSKKNRKCVKHFNILAV